MAQVREQPSSSLISIDGWLHVSMTMTCLTCHFRFVRLRFDLFSFSWFMTPWFGRQSSQLGICFMSHVTSHIYSCANYVYKSQLSSLFLQIYLPALAEGRAASEIRRPFGRQGVGSTCRADREGWRFPVKPLGFSAHCSG